MIAGDKQVTSEHFNIDELVGYAKANADAARTKDDQQTWAAHHRHALAAKAEIERLNEALHEERPELLSFDTILLLGRRILAIHYPESVFDGSSGDSGPEFVVALRAAIKRIDEQRPPA